jgi:thiol-disulfide isomerase/thioredoxin
MARTPSTMVALGTRLPPFSLPDPLTGRVVSATDVAGPKGTLVMFLCNHCPFVKHVLPGIASVASRAVSRGVGVVAISSNDVVAHPDDAPTLMKDLARAQGWAFPYLFDETQDVAKAFRAACTPDFFLFDAAARLVYRGQLDGSRPGNDVPVTGADLRAAIDALADDMAVPAEQRPSLGCNIKWRAGNEPEWFR